MLSRFSGVLAQFDSPSALLHAASALTQAGYTQIDAHSPFPIHKMDRALRLKASPIGWVVLLVGILSAVGAFGFQYWANGVAYPINVSGKPDFAYPSYMVITYCFMTIVTACTTALTMFALNGLPQLYHSLFKSARFLKVSTDGFFITVSESDPKFDRQQTTALLESLGGSHVEYVVD